MNIGSGYLLKLTKLVTSTKEPVPNG